MTPPTLTPPRSGSRTAPRTPPRVPPRIPPRGTAPRPRPAPRRRRRELTLGRTDTRLRTGFAVLCVLLLVVGGRLVQLQGIDQGGYAGAAAAQRLETVALHALRGSIVDRDGTVLAYTTDAQDITIDPSQVPAERRLADATRLAQATGQPVLQVAAALAQPGRYAVVARAQSPMVATKVAALGIPGVYTQPTTVRDYPGATTAANVVGLVHSDGSGAAGIEQTYQQVLAGTDGSVTYAMDNQGDMSPSGPNDRRPARNGGTVTLTVDQDLQYVVQKELDSAVQQSGARGAQVAVLDASTGEVLALGANGTFNSADPSTVSSGTVLDAPVQTVFEPGSVNKVVTFSAAVEKGLITPSTELQVPDNIATGGVVVHDDWGHPVDPYTATGILAQSSNVGTLMIADKLGGQAWYDEERKFGIGSPTGIELPGESAGILPNPATWSESSFANLPIGQGVAMTVLQLASMYQTIANDGVRVPPRIVRLCPRLRRRAAAHRPPGWRPGRHCPDGAHRAHDARVGDDGRRHGRQGGHQRVPRGGQDRHRTAARPGARRRLQHVDELGHLRRDGARRRPEVRHRRDGRQPRARPAGRRRGRAGVPRHRGVRAAARARPADRLAARARPADGLRRGGPPDPWQYRLLT